MRVAVTLSQRWTLVAGNFLVDRHLAQSASERSGTATCYSVQQFPTIILLAVDKKLFQS